jgi:hypothetical protein
LEENFRQMSTQDTDQTCKKEDMNTLLPRTLKDITIDQGTDLNHTTLRRYSKVLRDRKLMYLQGVLICRKHRQDKLRNEIWEFRLIRILWVSMNRSIEEKLLKITVADSLHLKNEDLLENRKI